MRIKLLLKHEKSYKMLAMLSKHVDIFPPPTNTKIMIDRQEIHGTLYLLLDSDEYVLVCTDFVSSKKAAENFVEELVEKGWKYVK